MIQLNRNEIPDLLSRNQLVWTQELLEAVKKYNGYSKIPTAIRDPLVDRYRNKETQNALAEMSGGKCVFCESIIGVVAYDHIEHFKPKSHYPKYTFKYSNLFLACPKCNIPKGESDTGANPIVNPVNDNPEEYFSYLNLRMIISPTSPDKTISQRTIECCDLRRLELSRARIDLMIAFQSMEDNIQEEIEAYSRLLQLAARIRKVNGIRNAIDNFKWQLAHKSQYAGFLRNLSKNSDVITNAIQLINSHRQDLMLAQPYTLL